MHSRDDVLGEPAPARVVDRDPLEVQPRQLREHGACGFGDGQHAASTRRQSPERGIIGALDATFAISPLVPGLRTGATPSAFSIRMNRSRSVFSWRCAISSSALMLTSYSMSDRTRSFADWRAWLISTKHDKKIASSDTIIVSRPNGNGSNGSNHGIGTTFIAIHTTNHTPLRMRNATLPENVAITLAIRSSSDSLLSAASLTLRDTRAWSSAFALRVIRPIAPSMSRPASGRFLNSFSMSSRSRT